MGTSKLLKFWPRNRMSYHFLLFLHCKLILFKKYLPAWLREEFISLSVLPFWPLLFISFPGYFLKIVLLPRGRGFERRIHLEWQDAGPSSCWLTGPNSEISFLLCVQWRPVGSLTSATVVVFTPGKCKHDKSGLPPCRQESWLLNTHQYTSDSGYQIH